MGTRRREAGISHKYKIMIKLFIKNRKSQKISVLVEENNSPTGLVFIMHGLGGFKEQHHINAMADAFKQNNYTVIRFDTTNSIGESEGSYEDATTTNYYEDLEDLICWAEKQSWYQEPFVLVGHSLGAMCISLYAQKYSEKIKAIAPISTVVSGKLSMETEGKKEWKDSGWQIIESASKPGLMKKLPWSHMEDRQKYDLLENVKKLTMPVLLIVGDNDTSTPISHQQVLYNALIEGRKELHVIKGSGHNFRKESEREELKQIFDAWIKKL